MSGQPIANGPSSASVLLVDDSSANLLALEAVLSPLAVRTTAVSSASAALEHVVQQPFAVALIDVQMPEMDGFELTRRIRELEHGRELPIVLVTAIYQDEEFVRRGYAAGAADYITKPYDPYIIRARVKAFVDLYQQREAVHRQQV
ncbi:MAG TPA: response regulator, partial [Polyangiaceae bacterium]